MPHKIGSTPHEDDEDIAGDNAAFPFDVTILVIDDEDETGELLRLLVKNAPCRILTAQTVHQGLRLAKSELPDLVIVDLHMPGLGGQELCRRLRADSSGFRLPILVLTGDARIAVETACLDAGADDFLPKGSPNQRVLARIRCLIRRVRFNADAKGTQRVHGVTWFPGVRELRVLGAGEPVHFTKKEAAIVTLLMGALGATLDAGTIHKKVWNTWDPRSTAVKVHISNLRHKLGRYRDLIETVNGDDRYRLNVELAKSLDGPAPSRPG